MPMMVSWRVVVGRGQERKNEQCDAMDQVRLGKDPKRSREGLGDLWLQVQGLLLQAFSTCNHHSSEL